MSTTTSHQEASLSHEKVPNTASAIEALRAYGRVADIPRDDLAGLMDDSTVPESRKDTIRAALHLVDTTRDIDYISRLIVDACKEAGEHGDTGADFDIVQGVEGLVENISGWDRLETNGRITPEYASARKETVLKIVELVRDIRAQEVNPDKPLTGRIAGAWRDTFLGCSPNMLDYLGGTEANLEVLQALSTVPELRSAYITKCHGMAYDLAFDPECGHIVEILLEGRTTKDQLRSLRVIGDVTSVMQYSAGYETAEVGAKRIADRLWRYVSDDKITAWMPSALAQSIVNRVNLGNADSDSVEGIAPDIIADEKKFARNKHFTGDWAKFRPIQLAPNIVGARNQYGTVEGASYARLDQQGEIVGCATLDEMFHQSGISVTDEDVELFQELYNPGMLGYLEWQLGGVRLSEFDLGTQLRLVNFVGTRSLADFGRVADMSGRLSPEDRQSFLGAFLATEYGEEFGNTLLCVVEKSSSEEFRSILERITEIRRYGARFAEIFDGQDGQIGQYIQRAIGERVTEALYVAKDVLEHGSATTKVLGKRITVTDMSEVDDALRLIMVGLQRFDNAYRSGVTIPTYDEENRSAWHLGVESDVLFQIKPRGEERGGHRRGVEHSEEGQINASIDVTSEDGEYVPISLSNYRRRYALSIRIDLEGILRDVNGGKVGFDATSDFLHAALDIGSLRGQSDNPNVRVARIISLGNKLRKRSLGQGRSLGYHTTLPRRYGRKKVFAELSESMQEKFRRRALGRDAVASALGQSPDQSSASRSEKAVA